MSIEYSNAIGFGVVIPKEKADEIDNFIQEHFDIDKYDDFTYKHMPCINSWIGDTYFFGFVDYLGDDEVIDLDNFFSNYTVLDFDYLIDDWELNDIISTSDYFPTKKLITFCY